ncbi:primase-helicase family protein [Ollibium composti]|uniref:NrS-1 polymerase-like helicase domain-containing protein n=1 Tax=Ollibium composti TaxID=2675109 RepID=A0ABY2QCP8_9HYPH|nr:primase-helicase family protein [Mesorhizobium composti]THF59858.1 hypothetical protein E6C48_02070 [Mesorhizobium composti]
MNIQQSTTIEKRELAWEAAKAITKAPEPPTPVALAQLQMTDAAATVITLPRPKNADEPLDASAVQDAQKIIRQAKTALIASGLSDDAAEASILWAIGAGHSEIKAVVEGKAGAVGTVANWLVSNLQFFDVLPDAPAGGDVEIAVTFGSSQEDTEFPPAERMTWAEFCRVMTRHQVGQKAGPCIVPAILNGTRRLKLEAKEIHVLVLDYDQGNDLATLVNAIEGKGWTAAIASTHSHLTTETKVKDVHWRKYLEQSAAPSAAELLAQKGYVPSVCDGAKVDREVDGYVFIRHPPCPKFRVALRLAKPWRAADYASPVEAVRAWAEAYEAVADALGIPFDESCTDASRLFYMPRHPANVLPVSRVLHGAPCDAFSLVAPRSSSGAGKTALPSRRTRSKKVEHVDASTGEVFDLTAWLREFGRRFLIVDALRARRPDVFANKVSDARHHVLCPFEGEHSEPGMDSATFVANAGEGATGGFVIHCRHAHCNGRDRAAYVSQMLEDGWLEVEDLKDPRYLLPEPDPVEVAIERLNASEAVVVIGGKTRILIEDLDRDGQTDVEFAQVPDRRNWHAPDRVMIDDKQVPVFDIWLNSPKRRQYSAVVFEPGGARPDSYNLWRGFAVEPDPRSSCDRFLDHLRENVCRGDEHNFNWLVGWLAQMVQQPSEKPGVAVVLRGGRGVGKTIVGEYVGAMMYRRNYVQITQPKQLVGNFNAHLKQALLIQVEEAFYAGDPKIDGPLKNLVTSDVRMVEPKGVDAFPVRDCARVLITSNEALVVPAGNDERRWAVFDVGDGHKQDHVYFAAIADELAHGGAGALLAYLQEFDLGGVNIRLAPETAALLDQKLNSLPSMPKWLHACLREGAVDTSGEWPEQIATKQFYEAYRHATARDRYAREISQEYFGKLLREIIPLLERVRPSNSGPRPWVYAIPSLDVCRASFSKWIGQDVPWSD